MSENNEIDIKDINTELSAEEMEDVKGGRGPIYQKTGTFTATDKGGSGGTSDKSGTGGTSDKTGVGGTSDRTGFGGTGS